MAANATRKEYTPCSFLDYRQELGREVTQHLLDSRPQLIKKYGALGLPMLGSDVDRHLLYLGEAVAVNSPLLFRHYAEWVEEISGNLGIDAEDLAACFGSIAEVLEKSGAYHDSQVAVEYMQSAVPHLGKSNADVSSPIDPGNELARTVFDELLSCRQYEAIKLVDEAAAAGMPLLDVYLNVFQPVLREIGRRWQQNQVSVAQEHYCSAAIQLMMGRLSDKIFTTERNGHTIVAACVGSELHEIGVRMVADALESTGWNTHFLGANVPTTELIELVRQTRADILCLSTTLTSHLSRLNEIIQRVRDDESLRRVKIVVGGYPFNLEPDLWRTLGSDDYASDAASAVSVCSNLVKH